MKMHYAIFNQAQGGQAKAQELCDFIHAWLGANRGGYNADQWAVPTENYTTQDKWAVPLPSECFDFLTEADLANAGFFYTYLWGLLGADWYPPPDEG